MSISIDPLGNPDVQRALAFARARERYPAAERETLLECCTAAWEAALEADSFGEQLTERFEGTLALLAWTHGWTRRPVDLQSLQRRAIPFAALQPFMADGDAKTRLEKLADAELAPAPPPAKRRSRPLLPRIPFVSPVPMGAAMAAGIVAVAGLNSTGAISLGPLDRSGGDGPSDDEGSRPQAKADGDTPAPPVGGGSGGSATGAASTAGAPASESGDDATVAVALPGTAPDSGIPAAVSTLDGPPAAGAAPASAAPAPVATPVVASGGAPAPAAPVARPAPVSVSSPPSFAVDTDDDAIEIDADPVPEPPVELEDTDAEDAPDTDTPEDDSGLPDASAELPGGFDVETPEVPLPSIEEPPVIGGDEDGVPGEEDVLPGDEDVLPGDQPEPSDPTQPGDEPQGEGGSQPGDQSQGDQPQGDGQGGQDQGDGAGQGGQQPQQPQADQQPKADTPPAPTPAAPAPPPAPAPAPAPPAPTPAPAAPAPPAAPAAPAAPTGAAAPAPAPPAPPAG